VRAFLVTGVSGAGKSTVARRLAAAGHWAVSADGDDLLCSWTDHTGRPARRPAHPDAAWLADHEWRWDPDRLDAILAHAATTGVPAAWVCGRADNAHRLLDRFDVVFLLDVDSDTAVARLSGPGRGNDFGRVGDTLTAALAGHGDFVRRWRARGAIPVDARSDLDAVVRELLRRSNGA
jgi:thymidylate kinase